MSDAPYLIPLESIQAVIRFDPRGNLDLSRLSGAFELPDGTTVPGDLILSGSKCRKLPAVHVAGSCYLEGSSIEEMSPGTVIGGNLYMKGHTLLTSLPDDIVIGGRLSAAECRFTRFGENIIIQGDAIFTDSILPDFPASMVFKGSLDCTHARFLSECPFPKGFRVPGDLILDSAKVICRLPVDLDCGGLHARYLTIRLSPGTRIRGDAFFEHARVSGVPEDVSFGGNISFVNAFLNRLPARFFCPGTLDLTGCTLTALPEHIHVERDLILITSRVRRIPATAKIRGQILLGDDSYEQDRTNFMIFSD